MLIDNVPKALFDSFNANNSFVVGREMQMVKKLVDEPQALDASEYVNILNFASTEPKTFNEYSDILTGNPPYCQTFVERRTGDKEPGLLKMSDAFTKYLLQPNMFNYSISHHKGETVYYPSTVFTGIAENLNEIRSWVQVLGDGDCFMTNEKVASVKGHDFIIRVMEGNDFLQFMFLYHVSEWAENLRQRSYYAKKHDSYKQLVITSSANGYHSWELSSEYMEHRDERRKLEKFDIYQEQYQERYEKFKSPDSPYLFFEVIKILSTDSSSVS